MRHFTVMSLCIAGTVGLAACDKGTEAEVERAIEGVNVIDETNLNDIMLTVADPNEAVAYFRKTAHDHPERMDVKRGLARSLIRAKRHSEAVPVWAAIVASKDVTNEDRLGLADALIRNGEWKKAKTELDRIPPTYETYQRYRLEAMVADAGKQWKRADSFYETAVGLTTTPAGVLNNWGYSKLIREDYEGAERLFTQAIRSNDKLFTAKNNLVLARAAQRNYNMPVLHVSQVERAQLLHTMALSAIKQGDIEIGRGLLRDAVETHPQHFEAAARSLKALEDNVIN